MHTWTFRLKSKFRRVNFWDSRLSGKKKISVDDKILDFKEESDHYKFSFKIEEYNFTLKQISDEKFKLEINGKDFMDLMNEERRGEFQRKKNEYLGTKEKEKKKNNFNNREDDYYKRAMKYNGENYFEGEEDMYDIEEQRKRLEEFERKKKKINNDGDDFYDSKKTSNGSKFILDNRTVNSNRMIICSLENIFGDEVQGDEFNFRWDNGDDNNFNLNQNKNNRNNYMQGSMFNDNNNNNGNNNPNYDKKILESNPDYYLNQMNNNLNNANNPHNQAILNQFLNFNDQGGNNNNNSYNYNTQFQNNNGNNNMNNNNFNNMQFQNNNFSGQNNQNGNNKYDDDFNPFDD